MIVRWPDQKNTNEAMAPMNERMPLPRSVADISHDRGVPITESVVNLTISAKTICHDVLGIIRRDLGQWTYSHRGER